LSSPAAHEQSNVALCPAVVGRDGEVQALHRGFIESRPRALPAAAYREPAPEVGFSTFVGLMVRTETARALDPPRADFFIWADDYEYCYRLRERGAIRVIPSAVILHKDLTQAFTNRRSRLFNRLLGWDYAPTRYEAAWRNLCGIRNWAWIKRRYEG